MPTSFPGSLSFASLKSLGGWISAFDSGLSGTGSFRNTDTVLLVTSCFTSLGLCGQKLQNAIIYRSDCNKKSLFWIFFPFSFLCFELINQSCSQRLQSFWLATRVKSEGLRHNIELFPCACSNSIELEWSWMHVHNQTGTRIFCFVCSWKHASYGFHWHHNLICAYTQEKNAHGKHSKLSGFGTLRIGLPVVSSWS